MANPQIEDGHLDLANEIVDALAKIRIAGEEMQCLWVILRKTYGWHKKQDNIALSQFCEMTNLNKPAICRALQKLLSKKIILIIKNDNGISGYGFNKDFDEWQPLSKKITLSKKIKGGLKKDNESLSKKRHTKENIQKKILQKKISDDEFLKFLKEKFTWIDLEREIIKIDAWILAHPGRQKTRRFIVNWLSKIDQPMKVIKPGYEETEKRKDLEYQEKEDGSIEFKHLLNATKKF